MTKFSDIQLLVQLIGSNTPQETARQILSDLNGLKGLAQLAPEILSRHPSISPKAAERIYAGIQIGQRSLLPNPKQKSITSPQQAYELLWPHLQARPEESLYALYLNRRRTLISLKLLTQGSAAYTIVDPRQIFHYAIQARAAGIILAHNHPSGDPSPSQQDILITERIQQIGSLLHIPLLDHVIVGEDSFVSFASMGLLEAEKGRAFF